MLALGDSGAVQPGEAVVAIGNPLGFDFSVTSGIVSAVHRNLQSPNGSVIPNGIQTDAAINSGNSGGPLFDSSGNVIGINEQIASESGGNQGLGFAVPINTAKKVMEQLKTTGKATYAYLGVQGQTLTADVATALGVKADKGVLVATVSSGSPAEKAGIKGGTRQTVVQNQTYVLGGDVIQAVDGVEVAERRATRRGDHRARARETSSRSRSSATARRSRSRRRWPNGRASDASTTSDASGPAPRA